MPWYEDWFDSDAYELVYGQRDLSDARRLADLVERAVRPAAGARVLDVGCGRGRHARILAARGYRVTGVDLSPRAVRTARRRAADEGVDSRVRFEQGDMRHLAYEAAFDGAVNLFTSFGYFDADADHQAAIDGIARALVDGGWFVQDFLNAPHVREHLVPEDERVVDGPGGSGRVVRVRQERWLEGDRVRKRITFHRNGAGDDLPSFTESVRLLTIDDFRRMYAAAGLTLTHTFGDYGGEPHTPESPRLILCTRKGETGR